MSIIRKYISKSMPKSTYNLFSKKNKRKNRPDKIIIESNPFERTDVLKVESIYDDSDYIPIEDLIKKLKNNNNYKLTSNQNEKLKHFIKEQYILNQISNNDLTLYKNIYPAFMDELKKKYKQKTTYSTIYIPKSTTLNKKLLPIRDTSKYKKKPKSKTGKKKPKSKTGKKKHKSL